MTGHNEPPDQGNHETFSIFIAGDDLAFRQLTFDDQRVEADQILRIGGYNPTLDHRLIELTFPGTKSWDDDETICLDADQPRYFLAGKSDRLFTFAIDDIAYETPFARMAEPQLRLLADLGDDKLLVLTQENNPDQELAADDIVSFEGQRVERLYQRDATVTVCLDNEGERELPRGSYMFKRIVALLGIPAGYVLSYVNAAGKLMPFKEGDKLELFDGIKFFSHAAGGGAS